MIPNVIAVKTTQATSETDFFPQRHIEGDKVTIDEDFELQRLAASKDFRARMRYYKRRILPNSRETVANYNKKQEPETIADHNDPILHIVTTQGMRH